MSASVAPSGEVLPFHPSQAQYEHVARRLCRFGRVPGVKLKDLDFRVLCYLSGQQPGAFHHQYTIAEELDRGPDGGEGRAAPDAVHRALNRLRAARLVRSDAAWEGTRSLPRRQYAPTRTCVYWLTHELCALLAAEERRRAEAAADARANPARAADPAPSAPDEPPPDVTWAEPEIQKMARAFDALRLRKACGLVEVQTLRKRMREGCSLESLWLAVAGARARVTRADGSLWAKDAFAVCFASGAHVGKTAQEGLAIRAAAERYGAAPSAPAPAEPAEAAPRSALGASPMPAQMRSSSGSQEIIDPEPDLKTSTSEPERPEGPTRRPAGDQDARPEPAGKSRAAPAAPASEPRLRAPIATTERDERAERVREHGPCRREPPPSATPPPPPSARARAETAWTVGANPRPVLTGDQMRLDVERIFAPQGRHGEAPPRGWRGPRT